MNFELYEELEGKVELEPGSSLIPKPDDVAGWRKICTIINSFELEEVEAILQFIFHHYLLEQGFYDPNTSQETRQQLVQQLSNISETRKNVAKQPYNVQPPANMTGGKGCMFTLQNLPDKLKKIIALYVLG